LIGLQNLLQPRTDRLGGIEHSRALGHFLVVPIGELDVNVVRHGKFYFSGSRLAMALDFTLLKLDPGRVAVFEGWKYEQKGDPGS
jgi:hypothetical protein